MNNSSTVKEALDKHAAKMELWLLGCLERAADDTVAFFEGEGVIPIDTANLHDSTGIGVYYKGSLVAYKPMQLASVRRDGVWGAQQLTRALELAASEYNEGLWMVLVSTMPYAYEINLSHGDWFNEELVTRLKNRLLNEIR